MSSVTRVTVSTFGGLAGLAGIEHGIGEIWQGNVWPDGVVIQSWRGSPLFESLGGEPAMTLVPNLDRLGDSRCVWAAWLDHRSGASPRCCARGRCIPCVCYGWVTRK